MPIGSSDRILSQNLLEPTIRLLRSSAPEISLSPPSFNSCGRTLCSSSGLMCPLCVVKALVSSYLAASPSSSVYSMDSTIPLWSDMQDRLSTVASSQLYLSGRSNTLLSGDAYVMQL